MDKIAVLGDSGSVKGFAAAGLEVFPCDDEKQAAKILKKLAEEEYGIVYITEYFAEALQKEIKKYDEQIKPAIIPIPGITGNNGIGMTRIREAGEKAIGSDIIFNK